MKLSTAAVVFLCVLFALLQEVTARPGSGKGSKKGKGSMDGDDDDFAIDDAPVFDDDDFAIDDLPVIVFDDDDNTNDNGGIIKTIARPFLGSFNNVVEFLSDLAKKNEDEPGSFVDGLAEAACDTTLDFLGLSSVTCNCTGTAEGGNAMAIAECTSSYRCLAGNQADLFCGTGDATVEVGAGKAGMYSTLDSCLYLDVGALKDPVSLMDNYQLCFASKSVDGLKIETCTATINDQACTCEVCDLAVPAFTLDCSMINLSFSDKVELFGPKIEACSLLDFSLFE